MRNKFMRKLLIFFLFSSQFTLAEIPKELLYQSPQNIDSVQLATIQGFQEKSSPLKFVSARVYINQINGKATLNSTKDWNKIYSILPTQTSVRYISDTQQLYSSREITFDAKAGRQYQIKNNQTDKDSFKNGIQFWIEDLDTKEMVTPKQLSKSSSNQTQSTYIPVIINK